MFYNFYEKTTIFFKINKKLKEKNYLSFGDMYKMLIKIL